MSHIAVSDRREERTQALRELEQLKGKHPYLKDAYEGLAKASKSIAAAEPAIGFSDAEARDAVAKRTSGIAAVSGLLATVRQHATLGLRGGAATRAAAHYLLNGNASPHSFSDKEAALKYLIGALSGGSEKWMHSSKATAEALLHDLLGNTVERAAAVDKATAAHQTYATAASEWDKAFEIARHLVGASALLLDDASLVNRVIWRHPRRHDAPPPAPVPTPAPANPA